MIMMDLAWNCCKPYLIESGSDFVEEVPDGEQDIIVFLKLISKILANGPD